MKTSKFSNFLRDYMMSVVLVVLIILFGILGPTVAGRSFLTITNIFTLINQNAYLMILGVGITFIMLGGGMDLSTGYLISTVGMIIGCFQGLVKDEANKHIAKNVGFLLLSGILVSLTSASMAGLFVW